MLRYFTISLKKKEKDNFILLNFKLLALKKIHLLLLLPYSTFNFQTLNQLKNLEIHFLLYAK